MAFNSKTILEQRKELVMLAIQPGANLSKLCRRFGVSRRICYKWINRYREHGEDGLKDQSKRPVSSPGQTAKSTEAKIVRLRKQNPEWGARKLRVLLEKEHEKKIPSHSTITNILHRNDLISIENSQRHIPVQRFEYQSPNELWQMDFKGYFKLIDNSICYPLTIIDDHSRFNLCLQACDNQLSLTVRQKLTAIFRRYGLPEMILTDNGSPWGSAGNERSPGEAAFTALEIWLMRINIKVIHGRPYHPQTQGKDERFHRTLKTELLQYEQFHNFTHCQRRFDQWRIKYNQYRPHEAIGFKTPSQLYTQSTRSYPEKLPSIQYLSTDHVRKVQDKGTISFQNQLLKIGRGLVGEYIAIRATAVENVWEVYFCNQLIKNIIVNK